MWRRVVKLAKNFKGGHEPKVEISEGWKQGGYDQ